MNQSVTPALQAKWGAGTSTRRVEMYYWAHFSRHLVHLVSDTCSCACAWSKSGFWATLAPPCILLHGSFGSLLIAKVKIENYAVEAHARRTVVNVKQSVWSALTLWQPVAFQIIFLFHTLGVHLQASKDWTHRSQFAVILNARRVICARTARQEPRIKIRLCCPKQGQLVQRTILWKTFWWDIPSLWTFKRIPGMTF